MPDLVVTLVAKSAIPSEKSKPSCHWRPTILRGLISYIIWNAPPISTRTSQIEQMETGRRELILLRRSGHRSVEIIAKFLGEHGGLGVLTLFLV